MVVRLGLWKAALWMSSNPTTETSSGTRRPWSIVPGSPRWRRFVVADYGRKFRAATDQFVDRGETHFRR